MVRNREIKKRGYYIAAHHCDLHKFKTTKELKNEVPKILLKYTICHYMWQWCNSMDKNVLEREKLGSKDSSQKLEIVDHMSTLRKKINQ